MLPYRYIVVSALANTMLFAPTASHAQPAPVILEALPEHLQYLYSRPAAADPNLRTLDHVSVGNARLWENGRTLRVCLFAGNRTVATLIADEASAWTDNAGVKFDFGKGQPRGWYNCLSPANGHFQIRIGFSERGYWSAMGNDSEKLTDVLAPSMNLEHFNMKYTESRFSPDRVVAEADAYDRHVIRHEFGHALGLVHELQNPNLKCVDELIWTGPNNVYDVYGGAPNFWPREKVDLNLRPDTRSGTIAGPGDNKSEMGYWIPPQHYIRGKDSPCYMDMGAGLSPLDKQGIAALYPPAGGTAPAGEPGIAEATYRALPAAASAPTRDDALLRIKIDLDSADAFIRRDARARLADAIPVAPPGTLDALIEAMRQGSYRYKLGVAVALANQRTRPELSATARARLNQELKTARDATLQSNLRKAVGH